MCPINVTTIINSPGLKESLKEIFDPKKKFLRFLNIPLFKLKNPRKHSIMEYDEKVAAISTTTEPKILLEKGCRAL